MVKITIRPWEEVIIHESIQYSLEDLLKMHSIGVQPGGLANPLSWAEGVVFRFSAMPPTDEIVREQLQGKIHWNAVEWALMPEYKNVIMIQDINAKIPIVNVTATAILREVARVLKDQEEQRQPREKKVQLLDHGQETNARTHATTATTTRDHLKKSVG